MPPLEPPLVIRQCVTQCEPDSKAQKRTLTAALTTFTFKKKIKKKSTLLTVLLKAGLLVKLTEVGRLFHALMTLLAQGRINKCGGPVRNNVWGPPPPPYTVNFIIKYRIDKDLDNKLDF